jgi:NAD(P)-dependent dehydrogenase (short-subunit alcohol dehydrogenase family)
MRILLVGATGTIGSEIAKALQERHEVVAASRRSGIHVDIEDPSSVRSMYREAGTVDAVICAVGSAVFKPFEQLTDDDWAFSVRDKLLGNVTLVRHGIDSLRDGGSFTLTTGILAQQPVPGGAAYSLVNAALEGFVRAAALEMTRGIRINAVSPGWISETLAALGQDPSGGLPAREVAKAYVEAVEGRETGRIIAAERAAV